MNRFDALVIKRKAKRTKDGKPVVVPKKRGYPLGIERAYATDLLKYARKLNKILKEEVSNNYLRIRDNAQREKGIKFDAYDDDLEEMFQQMGIRVSEELPQETIDAMIEKRGLEVNDANREAFAAQYQTITGVEPFASEPWLAAKSKAFVSRNATLITKMTGEMTAKVETIVNMGVERGWTLKQVTEEVQKATNFSKNRSKLIARDQVASLNSEITKIRQKEQGLDRYVWSTSLDERVRSSHKSKEGKIFSWDKPPADTGHPGEDINCRCVALPYFEDLDEEVPKKSGTKVTEDPKPEPAKTAVAPKKAPAVKSTAQANQKITKNPQTEKLRAQAEAAKAKRIKAQNEAIAAQERVQAKRKELQELTAKNEIKVTNLEPGVSIVEKNGNSFKLSKGSKDWNITFNGKTISNAKTKKEALELLKLADI